MFVFDGSGITQLGYPGTCPMTNLVLLLLINLIDLIDWNGHTNDSVVIAMSSTVPRH